jgi:hypothetical protein
MGGADRRTGEGREGKNVQGVQEGGYRLFQKIISNNPRKTRLIPYYGYSAFHHKNIQSDVNNKCRDQTTLLFNVAIIQPIVQTISDYLYRLRPTE